MVRCRGRVLASDRSVCAAFPRRRLAATNLDVGGLPEERGDALPHQEVVIGQHHPQHGRDHNDRAHGPSRSATVRHRAENRSLHTIYGTSLTNPALVGVDFERDDLADRLADSGFQLDRPTMFIREGVTQYLAEPTVRSTLTFLETASSGSSLIFTFVRADFLYGTNLYGGSRSPQLRHSTTAMALRARPRRRRPLVDKYGWDEREQVGARALRVRYIEPTDAPSTYPRSSASSTPRSREV
jgi:hypothetical protein